MYAVDTSSNPHNIDCPFSNLAIAASEFDILRPMNTRTGSNSNVSGLSKWGRGTPRPATPWELPEQLEPRTLASANGLPDTPRPTPVTSSVGVINVGADALVAPGDLAANPTVSRVALTWSAAPSGVTAIVVLRSTNNGATFTTLATLARTAVGYNDNAVISGTAYVYKLRVTGPGAPAGVSSPVSTRTPIRTPTALSASISGSSVALRWADTNRTGTGYLIFRSTDGTNFTQIATLAANSAKSYVDRSVAASTAYFYRVQSKIGSVVSENSNSATATTPDGTSAVTIATRYTNELVITSLAGSDTIAVSQSGSDLSIVINGQTFTRTSPAAGLFIYNRGGADTITIDASVSVQTTITSIGDGISTITSGITSLNAWIDTTDQFSGSGIAHRIAAFAGGVSKAVGVSLAKASDAGATTNVVRSLFGTGPDATDINQGSIGDCYLLTSLAGFAEQDSSVLVNSAADLGDGTYVVQFIRSNAPVYVRVSNALSVGGFAGLKFAHPGANNTIWGPIMEKAWAYFRASAHTYASISSGWMGEVYTALGVANTTASIGSSDANFFNMVSAALADGKAVTFGTHSSSPNLVRGHAYTLISATRDGSGIARFVVRNPWGVSGVSIENSGGYATLTFAQMQSNFSATVLAIA